MALNIKNEDAENLAREVSRRCGISITQAVTDALREKLQRERNKIRPEDVTARSRRISEIVRHYNSLPELDRRSDDEIVGYGEHGHFD